MTTYSAVVTTGIYCRPGCGARPLAENVRIFGLAAAAEAAGFRACYRCRPYRVAGPVPSGAPELACQAVQLIIEGALDDGGKEEDLARRIGVSARHLRRLFLAHLGVTPDQLARSRRAHFARRLLDDTDLPVVDVAFASGFGSLRQFNRAMREVFGDSPTSLRGRRRRADRLTADGGLVLRLPVLPGYDWRATLAFLRARFVPGVETADDGMYRRTISVAGAPGVLEVSAAEQGSLMLRAHLPYWEGLIHVVDRAGRLLGIDADHSEGIAALSADPLLGELVRLRPGLAVPGAWNLFEVGCQAILSRDRKPGDASQALEALVTRLGTPVAGLAGGLTHVFPAAATVAEAADTGLCGRDDRAVRSLAAALRSTSYAVGSEGAGLLAGVDPDIREYLALRTGQRSAFPASDPSLTAGLDDVHGDMIQGAGELAVPRRRWQPWLPLAAVHLMAHGDGLRLNECSVSPVEGRRPEPGSR